jgi:putative DNA primase/helicase
LATDYAWKVANELIDQLEQGTAPWQKPWQPGERFMPYNPTTGKDYRGGNSMWLMAQGYADARWMTYRQATAEGAQVRKGEHGTQIQYWIVHGAEPVTDAQGKPVRGEDGKPLTREVEYERPRVKTFTVFNGEQIDGLTPAPPRTVEEWQRHQRAEAIMSGSGADIEHQAGNKAYYQPSADKIVMPERRQFPGADGYYSTALHELGHWTGAPDRLNRDLAHPFGSESYAREELRAEIASLMLGTEIGIGHDPSRHAAYVGSWIKVLENDPQEIFRAAADAEKITAMLRGFERAQEQGEEQRLEQQQAPSAEQAQEPEIVMVRAPTLIREEHPVMSTSTDRTYLAVPYAEKDQAKALGAQWDREAKAWFAPAGTDPAPLSAWLPSREGLHAAPEMDPREEFGEAIRLAGLKITGTPEMDGKLYRVQVAGDTGQQRSGAYAGFLDGHPAGYIQNFKTGLQQNWKSGAPMQALGAQDRARLTAEAAQKSHERAGQRESVAQAAALTAVAAWDAAEAAPADHPYALAKQITPNELRVGAAGQTIPYVDKNGVPREASLTGKLIVPLRDIDGRLTNIQTIDSDGTKTFHKNGRVEGMHTIVGGELGRDSPVIIAEGYATAKTISQATSLPVIAAFNAGNIAPVAQLYRDRFPERSVIIAGDNDHSKSADQNVGRRKSEEVAVSVGGFTMLPDFAPNDRGTDWNDYAQTNGMDATRQALASGMRSIEAKQLAADSAMQRQEREQEAEAKGHERVEERQAQAYEDEQVEIELVERQQEAEQEHEQGVCLGR